MTISAYNIRPTAHAALIHLARSRKQGVSRAGVLLAALRAQLFPTAEMIRADIIAVLGSWFTSRALAPAAEI